MDDETLMDLLTEVTDLLNEARFLEECDDAIRHLQCAETVETVSDLIANLDEAAAAAKKKSIARQCKQLAAKCRRAEAAR